MKHDVLILGGGVAGLAAARDLTGRGLRVCLLEARGRLGGRIHTLHVPGAAMPVELGAEFVHGEAEATFAIIDAASLLVQQLPDTHWWSRNGKWQLAPDFMSAIDRVMIRIGRLHRDVSFADFLRGQRNLSPRLRQQAIGFVEGFHAAHADRISTLSLGDSGGGGTELTQQFRITNGYDALVSWLRAGIDPDRGTILINRPVEELRWRRGEVEAVAASETVRAKCAVITLPVGVLKSAEGERGSIRFEPELRAKWNALRHIEVGHVVKIVFRFRERFWNDGAFIHQRATTKQWRRGTPLHFVHTSDRYVPVWWTSAPARTPLLTGWSGGHAADGMLAEGREGMIELELEAMSRAFAVTRRTIDRLLAATYLHDWQSDPFSRGAYSYAGVGGSGAHEALAKPLQSTLYFAGEATNASQTGTVAGAIESGHRAARQVLARLAG